MNARAPVIRPALPADWPTQWAILEPIFRAGETYAVDPQISEPEARAYWCGPGHAVWVAEAAEGVLGTYFLCANKPGGGAHVANAAFATAAAAQGRGLARAMLDHALAGARAAGFRAMQFNFVVASNARAVATWQRAGFDVVGRLPGAFRHPRDGYVDALVMYRTL
ncbi:GNAT family N-acetyltransferase [Roseivivax sp. CAU 1761]